MNPRRLAYWGGLLAALVVIFVIAPSNEYTVCDGRPDTRVFESAPGGISLFPPGYECLYIGREDEVIPLDVGGWLVVGAWLVIAVLVLGGALPRVRSTAIVAADLTLARPAPRSSAAGTPGRAAGGTRRPRRR